MALDRERQLRLGMDDPVPDRHARISGGRTRPREGDTAAQDERSTTRPGRRPDAYYKVALGSAILNLGDRASLDCNVLAQLTAVRKLADERYQGKIWRRGLCLRDLIQEAVDETLEAADGRDMERVRFVLTKAASGETLSSIARELGIHRESLSRRLWSKVTGLVWERLKPRLLALESSTGR